MAIIGTYYGVSILALPSFPLWKQVQFDMNDSVTPVRSPYTGATQMQAWPGGDWWEASLTLPQLTPVVAQTWTAFLAECRGMLNCFYLSDPLHAHPSGRPFGNPVVSGVNNAMATSLNTRGWTPSTLGHLLPGDQLQIGYRLHRVLERVDSDANGNATISIWPSVRDATTDGEALTLNNPQGLFRLSENKRSVLTTETQLTGISLKCMEAR